MNAATNTIGTLLDAATGELQGRSDSPVLDAELLLGHVLGLSRAVLRAREDEPVPPVQARRFAQLVTRRADGAPVAYLTGRRAFWDLELEVGPGVLVPRPETELLVEAAVAELRGHRAVTVLDLGTGSGAIALAIAVESATARVTAVEASAAALAIARRNAESSSLAPRVECLGGEWYLPVAGRRFDLIVSNPPYLAADDPHLAALFHEPAEALVAGPTGLEALEVVVAGAPAHLRPGGLLLVEHGAGQGPAVRQLCTAAGLREVHTLTDLAGLERVTAARCPASAPGG